jgi:glycosyltransferase involved in cell wall biosynthesis
MNQDALRVAFFPDAYHEVDGVANTSRHFEAFAARRELPFLTVLGGTQHKVEIVASVRRVELPRGNFRFPLDKKHDFDLAFLRHYDEVEKHVRDFNPDIIHITGPSDVGILGCFIAHRLKIPLAASWHTNLHQYAEQRSRSLLGWLPRRLQLAAACALGRGSLACVLRYYHIPQILFAPNQELIDLIEQGTGKPCYVMARGVDAVLFDPCRRSRGGGPFVIGYVGRLTIEKNIRLLAEIESALLAMGCRDFVFSIVGQGAEQEWLQRHMRHAQFPGVLRGQALAEAYANMDVFVFPSETDTYGNVVLEAQASGVPALVTANGGPRFIIRSKESGFIAEAPREFAAYIARLQEHPGELARMRAAARATAVAASWDSVFDSVYSGYERGMMAAGAAGKKIRTRSGSSILHRVPRASSV